MNEYVKTWNGKKLLIKTLPDLSGKWPTYSWTDLWLVTVRQWKTNYYKDK